MQKMFHMGGGGKGKAGGTDLPGKLLCAEGLFPRHKEKIEFRLLAVAEKQIFADVSAQPFFHPFTVIDRGRGLMVEAFKDCLLYTS